MTFSPGLVAFLAACAVITAAFALLAPRKRVVLPASSRHGGEESSSLLTKWIHRGIEELAPVLGVGAMSEESRTKKEKLIIRSGNPWNLTVEQYEVSKILLAAIMGSISLVIVFSGAVPVPWYVVVAAFSLLGYIYPFVAYDGARERRAQQIRRQMPEAIELLVITMAAGNNFIPAMGIVVPKMADGILKNEFEDIVKDIRSGRPLESALSVFADRASSDEAENFARAVEQAERLGSDVTEALRSQARISRKAYDAALSAKIARLPTQVVLFLTPTMIPALGIFLAIPQLAGLSLSMDLS